MSQDSNVVKSTESDAITTATNDAVDAASKQSSPSKSSRSAHPLSWINFVLLLVLIGFAGYFGILTWQQQQAAVSQLAVLENRIGLTESNQSDDKQRYQELTDAALELSSTADQLQQQVLFNTDRLAKLPGAERQDWLLAEVEYLLRLANQRLSIERDWNSAISLLTAADNVLLETRNPRFNVIRSQISREIQTLRAIPAIDKSGTIFKIQTLQESIANLSWVPQSYTAIDDQSAAIIADPKLASEEVSDQSAELLSLGDIFDPFSWDTAGQYAIERWSATQDYLTNNLAALVRVRHLQEDMPAPLSPQQQYYLQQNMFLMLEQAQVALLRQQTPLYQHSIQRVVQWTNDFVVMDDPQSVALLTTLNEIQDWDAAPALPDISQSLLDLRRLLEQQRRGSVIAKPAADELQQLSESR